MLRALPSFFRLHHRMLSHLLVALAALGIGFFVGGRTMLARQRIRELRAMFDRHRNTESLEQAFVATVEQRRQFEAANLVHHVRVVNAIQFVILWNWDLTSLLAQLDQTREAWSQGWNRKLQARVLALTIYESLIKLKDLLDKDWSRKWSLRRALQVLKAEPVVGPELDHLHARLVALFDQHQELLKGIRDNAIGHRDQDVSLQMQWVRNAKIEEIEQLGWQLVTWTTDLIRCLTSAIQDLQRRKLSSSP